MKLRVTLKDPDAVYEAIEETIETELEIDNGGRSEDEQDDYHDERKPELVSLLGKWFKYQELLAVEIDTETETIRVLTSEEV